MSFRFALAPLLRLRQSIERQRTLQLRDASLQVVRAEEGLAQIDHALAASIQSDAQELKSGRTAAEIQFSALVRENLLQYRENLQVEVRKLVLRRHQAVSEYQQAFREREVLEALRTRLRQSYDREQLRREQQQLDAAYLLQRWHREK
jgi:flagellar export protein FliJ